ncbi:NeuD/PglB/VioB family sugar acetyltransferase [Pseudomonas gingeri]|uniref:NeuD/PglB/VioB family sugar acetyltransferase n=1 Tax=Pseudomonas gingeri TaxID=117681 RepID=UPI001C42F07A|nr:NeuD/PglB/VioB family sugar acetyltransferase [Pseudomonas gingeri]
MRGEAVAVYSGLLILGFGGHARSIADVGLSAGIARLCFVDKNARPDESFVGFEVLPEWVGELPEGWAVIPGSGDNFKRQSQLAFATEQGWPIATLVAPTATLGVGSTVGAGSFVAQHAHVGPMASVGKGCIVNSGAIIEHDCVVGDYTHVSIGACVAGRSRIGRYCFLGAGSTVIDGLSITDSVILGAGGCATQALELSGTYVGVPARLISGMR